MIGLDFPIKPEWIYAVLNMWKPHIPITNLIDSAVSEAMPELRGDKTRRNSLSIIIRMFVPTTQGNSKSRETTSQNAWVDFAKNYSALSLAPAFLARIISESEVAQEISNHITRRYRLGSILSSNDIRNFTAGKFGERKVVSNAASAFLTTLSSFGVIQPGESRSKYIVQPFREVSKDIFPLLVWAWWEENPVPQINLEEFYDLPSYRWLNRDDFVQLWKNFQPNLWSISERLDSHFVTFKYQDPSEFEKRIIELL